MAQRPDDLTDAPEGLPSRDLKTVSPVACHETDPSGHGDDGRLVSDISELSSDDQKTVTRPAKSTEFEVENEAPVLSRSGRATFPSIVEKPPEIVAESLGDGLPYTIPLHNWADDLVK